MSSILTLPKIEGKYRFNYKLAHLTWFKVGGEAEIFFAPKNIDDLIYFLQEKPKELAITIFGAGSNLIIRDGGVAGAVIRLGQGFTNIEKIDQARLAIGAGCLNYNLANYAKEEGISGFEFLTGVPGTIGGGIAMNAGCYGSEFKDIIEAVEAVSLTGERKIFSQQELGFVYRGNSLAKEWIFTRAICRIKSSTRQEIEEKMQYISEKRNQTQPIKEKTGGSSFANPAGQKAWQLIAKSGFRGYKLGGASISEKHCNFMINDGTATASELEKLGELIRAKIWQNFAIKLKWEIKIIGKKS